MVPTDIPADAPTPGNVDVAPIADMPPAVKITVATLSATGIFLGVEQMDATAKTADHIEVPADCDLAPGRCRWVVIEGYPGGGRFEYFGTEDQPVDGGSGISLDIALNALATALKEQGIKLPAAVTEWQAGFAKSIDSQ